MLPSVLGAYFARNRLLTGPGTGARLEYRDIGPFVLKLTGTTLTGAPLAVEMDSNKPSSLPPEAGSRAAATGAGLFLNV